MIGDVVGMLFVCYWVFVLCGVDGGKEVSVFVDVVGDL